MSQKSPLKIVMLPAFDDNYLFILEDTKSGRIAAIDPGDGDVIDAWLQKHGKTLTYILNTHHHKDHVGGNMTLKKKYGCKIFGPANEFNKIPGLDFPVKKKDKISLGDHIFEVIETPGHTLGHIVYFCADARIQDQESNKISNRPVLFCGDTLFAMGCGRLFEGTPEQMFESLGQLKMLPPETLIYCAHEYTIKNARFSLSLASEDVRIQARFEREQEKRAQDEPTVPTTLAQELETNLFLRANNVEEFAKAREKRDRF